MTHPAHSAIVHLDPRRLLHSIWNLFTVYTIMYTKHDKSKPGRGNIIIHYSLLYITKRYISEIEFNCGKVVLFFFLSVWRILVRFRIPFTQRRGCCWNEVTGGLSWFLWSIAKLCFIDEDHIIIYLQTLFCSKFSFICTCFIITFVHSSFYPWVGVSVNFNLVYIISGYFFFFTACFRCWWVSSMQSSKFGITKCDKFIIGIHRMFVVTQKCLYAWGNLLFITSYVCRHSQSHNFIKIFNLKFSSPVMLNVVCHVWVYIKLGNDKENKISTEKKNINKKKLLFIAKYKLVCLFFRHSFKSFQLIAIVSEFIFMSMAKISKKESRNYTKNVNRLHTIIFTPHTNVICANYEQSKILKRKIDNRVFIHFVNRKIGYSFLIRLII